MEPLELNEVLALVFVLVAWRATWAAQRSAGNTPRTRTWWGRFLVLLSLLVVAEVATNVEQFWPGGHPAHELLNLLEHLALLGAGGWAMAMAIHSHQEACARGAGGGEGA